MKHSTRQQAAREAVAIIEAGTYFNRFGAAISVREATELAVENSILYRTEDFPVALDVAKNAGETKWEVTPETTLQAAKRVCDQAPDADPFVLNFASAKNPGGGFLGGAQAQEESLARSSSLYACLMAHFEMYRHNRAQTSCFYSDWMIYSPRVPVFRDDDGALLDAPYQVSFLTVPAVNAGVVRRKEPEKAHRIEMVNRARAQIVVDREPEEASNPRSGRVGLRRFRERTRDDGADFR